MCPQGEACSTPRFDFTQQRCVDDALPDGTDCASANHCLEATRCEAGRCVGRAVRCDDGDACTDDVCVPERGCEARPAAPCPGDGACMAGVCDPATGCGLTPRDDGERCGQAFSCAKMEVCMAGACVERRPPEGFLCAEATPCQPAGRCAGEVCVQAAQTSLQPRWQLDTAEEGLMSPRRQRDFVLEPSGEVSLFGHADAPPLLRANTAPRAQQETAVGDCILFGGRHVCANAPEAPVVTSFDLASGAPGWRFDASAGAQAFVARLVALRADVLAVVIARWETSQTCLRFEVATLDATGAPLARWEVDPAAVSCGDVRVAGAAADRHGNLYLSLVPTVHLVGTDEAAPSPDRVWSWTPAGHLRWRSSRWMPGELAVTGGTVFSVDATLALDAETGQMKALFPEAVGQVLATKDTILTRTSREWETELTGRATDLTPRWRWKSESCQSVSSEEVRLATWQHSRGVSEVALLWRSMLCDVVDLLQGDRLLALDMETGEEVFSCPVDLRSRWGNFSPTRFEVGSASLTVMTGGAQAGAWPLCPACAPWTAASAPFFSTYETPTLSVSGAPWQGARAGASRDGRER